MTNPLTLVTADFWDIVRKLDRLIEETGQRFRPLLPQFERVKNIDTDAIRDLADDVWGVRAHQEGSLRHTLTETVTELDSAGRLAERGWSGDAAYAFSDDISELRTSVEQADEPILRVAEALHDLADSCDESLGDTITAIAGIGGVLTAIGGFAVTLLAAPEPVVTKVLGIIVGVVGVIVAAVALVAANVKVVEERQKAAEAAIDELRELVRAVD